MAYLLFSQHILYKLLQKAETHELLQRIEIFQTGNYLKVMNKCHIKCFVETLYKQIFFARDANQNHSEKGD